ncbi:MAG: ABC transporter permease subunit [Candidatus Hydrogenedentes bacterium]|nr:ABC transporter permease subunit [Candidatus Hydrogenedentota bacterium]
MIGEPIARVWHVTLGIGAVLLLLIAYTILSMRQHRENPDDKTIPSWSQLSEGVKKSVEVNQRSNERWVVADAQATSLRLFWGVFWGVSGSLLIGMLMGCFAFVEAFLYPPLAFLAKIPPIALLAVFFVLAGTGETMYVTMIAFGVLPTLAQTVYLAVKEVPAELRYKAYTLGASHLEIIWNVLLRHVLPKLIDAIRLQIGPAMVYLIAAEMVVGDVGFGYRIRLQFKLLNMSVVYPYIVVLGAFGFGIDYALRKLQAFVSPWYAKGY